MKILFAWIFKINPLSGGVERVTSIVMDELRSRGYQCDNIICENDNHDFYLDNEVTTENHLSVEQLKTYLKEQQYDVIICQDGYSISMTKTFREAVPVRTKIVTYLHNTPTMWEKVFCLKNVKREITRGVSFKVKLFWLFRLLIYPIWRKIALKGIARIYRMNFQYCDKYVLLSHNFFPDMKRYLDVNEDDKLFAIPNPLSFGKIESSDILKKKNKEVLIVTRLDETQKNVSFALKVWKILQKKGLHGWSLIIVGHGPDEVFLKKIVKKYRLSNVSFEGKQMPIPYYETASIFMMTSDFEGWGMTLTESQQMGVVPIARDSYLSLHDIITNGYNGCIVKNNDIEAYADKLQWLMANDEERKQIALNGLKSAQRFTSDKIADRWVEMMESL